MTVATKGQQISLERGPRTEEELYYLVQALWGHTIPRHKVCPEHDAPFDAFAHAYFARDPQILIHGSRGLAGKSRLLSILGLTQAAVLGSDVNILGGSLAQSTNIHETMRDAWDYEHSPKHLIRGDATQGLIELQNNAKIRPLTASQRTVRGPHPARLLLDEIDEMDEAILNAAFGQPMPQKNWHGDIVSAQTTMASTWQYPDGVFAKQLKRFREEDLPIYTWCFRDTSNPIDGWLDPEFIEQKKREIPAEMWRVEYELGEPSIGNRAIDSDAVKKMFDIPMPKKEDMPVNKIGKDYEEYQFEKYTHSQDYVIGADWAKAQDFTVISVFDVTTLPAKLVYFCKMRRRPYPVMVGKYNTVMRRFHAEGIHDATGLGGVIEDYIDERAYGFLMTGAKRDDMLSNYVNAVEKGVVKSPMIESAYKSTLYCSVEDLFARGKDYHLPDDVCSMALAWHLVHRRVGTVGPEVLEFINDPNWIEKEIANNKQHDLSNQKKSPWNVGQVERKRDDSDDSDSLLV